MTGQPIVYQLDSTDDISRDETKHAAVGEFLQAHGIDPMRFMENTPIYVRRHEDGSLWLHTWQAVEGTPLCENCPACVKQERVEVPLTAAVPALAEAFIAYDAVASERGGGE